MTPMVRAAVSFALIGVAVAMILLASDGPPLETLLPIAIITVVGSVALYLVRWFFLRRQR